ncbi:MAG: AI-2E family transporter, partial [Bacilli bacterium]|nr:AI-2E family transporter [Bacilli bacterium]
KILKILFVLFIILLIYVVTIIIREWNILHFLGRIFSIISPLFIGWFIAWLLNPFVKKLTKRGVKKGLSVAFAYIVLIVFIIVASCLTISSLGNQMSDLLATIPEIAEQVTEWIDVFFAKLSDLSLQNLDGIKATFMDKIEGYVLGIQTNLPETAMSVITALFSGVGKIALSFLLAFYISYDFDKVSNGFINLFPKRARNEVEYLLDQLNQSLHSFVSGTIWLSMLLFVVSVIGFSIIGLNAPVLISFICVITNLIPYIGPYMGAAVAGVLGFAQGPVVGILTLAFILVVQSLEGNILHPLVMSKKMNLSPITVIISLLVFEYMFGIIGMVIAMPVVAVLKIIYVFLDEKYDIFGFIMNED